MACTRFQLEWRSQPLCVSLVMHHRHDKVCGALDGPTDLALQARTIDLDAESRHQWKDRTQVMKEIPVRNWVTRD